MSYVDSNLMSGESVRYRGALHWIGYVPHIFLMFIAIGFVTIIFEVIRHKTTEVAITNKRVIIKTGWISRQTQEMSLKKIETVSLDQGILGRLLDYGTIAIIGSGGTLQPFKGLSSPSSFRTKFNEVSTGDL